MAALAQVLPYNLQIFIQPHKGVVPLDYTSAGEHHYLRLCRYSAWEEKTYNELTGIDD